MGVEVEPARAIAGRYRVARVLKRGPGTETLLARDLAAGADVVVKTAAAASVSAGAQARLEHEAEVLRALESPWIAPLVAFGREADLLYLVTPLVRGATLEERLRAGPLAPGEAATVGRCLLGALRDAHARGVLHRDVKPANVIVAGGPPLERATLIDFGFARSERLPAAIREEPVGTVRYVAPEQAGLLERPVDERSDLYAAGAVLYECLAGRPAFPGEAVGEVLRVHLLARPPGSRALGRATPRALDEIVGRLIRIEPAERYQSAAAALADLEEVGRALDAGEADPEVALGARDRRRTLTEPAFVGRAAELAALDAALERAREGRGGLVLLEAPSGGGKTRVLDELARRAGPRGARVFRGQGVDQTAPRPFEVLEGVVGAILAEARADLGFAALLAERLGDDRDAAGAAMPDLIPVLGAAAAPSLGPDAHAEVRTLRALATLLDALGAPGRPALVLLDDGQWADELTLRLVARWRQGEGEGSRHVAVVVSFRSEEAPPGHALRALPADESLAVRPLAPDETRRLAESMAGDLPADALAAIVTLAGGNPFDAAALLEGMVEGGALVPAPEGWRVEPAALAEIQVSHRAAVFAARRIERLGDAALRLLSVGAILGKEFDLGLAADLAGGGPAEVEAALAAASRARIVWTDEARRRCIFAHDKLREALLGRLAPGERRRLHALAAARIEADRADRVFELAYHFDGAGEAGRALPYAFAAAEAARARHAPEIAERYYRIADRAAERADRKTQLRAAEGLADVLGRRGRLDESEACYGRARALASGDRLAEARILGKLGHLRLKQTWGEDRGCVESLEAALRLLDVRVPRRRIGFILAFLREAAVQALHTLAPRIFARPRADDVERRLLAAGFLNRLSLAYFFTHGAFAVLWAHLRELNIAERCPPSKELGRAWAEHGWVLANAVGVLGRGLAYAAKGVALCRELGDLWGEGHGRSIYGGALCIASRYGEALGQLREAERLLRRVGDPWEMVAAQFFRVSCLYRTGELREAREVNLRALALNRSMQVNFGLLVTCAKVAPLEVPRDLLERELACNENLIRIQAAREVQADILLAEGRPAEAIPYLEKAVRGRVRDEWLGPVPAMLARALREEAARAAPWEAARREALLARAGEAARLGVRVGRAFRNNLPGALREQALVLAARGRPGRARTLLDESLALAERQGARFERAMTFCARGRLGVAFGWPGADGDARAGRAALREIGADPALADEGVAPRLPTLAFAERYDALLEAGRKIASAGSEEAVFAAVREAALGLLRAERCALFDPGAVPADVSRTAVERALAAGRAVALAEGIAEGVADSAVLSGVRSALCAPILVDGRAAACLYVTHAHVGNFFREEETRLADFIAALAGAGLENAAGLAANRLAEKEIRRLSESVVRGQEDERRALAMALHDGTGQKLAVLGLKLRELAQAEPGGAARVDGMRALLDEVLEDVRHLARDLRPATLDRLGLASALRDLAEGASTGGLAVEVRLEPERFPPVAPALAENLFRIAQAAIANTARHARARTARITLAAADGTLRLGVEDDGRGFDSAAAAAGDGMGLIGMRERAAWLGGRFAVESTPGRGTRISVEVPLTGGAP